MEGLTELSRREREVANLVAEGLTNRQIGQRLFISERTSEGHVERIRNKLGFTSRAQVAAWVTAHGAPAKESVLAAPPVPASTSGGILAFLLTDLEGSTRAWESNPAGMREAMVTHDAILAGSIERHGGTIVESGREGDSILAAFPNAPLAAAAALEIGREIASAKWPAGLEMRIRLAIHAGEAQFRAGHYFGQALNRCARLLSVCHPGQILVSNVTQELLADDLPVDSELLDLGLHGLKDIKRPEHVFQLADRKHPAHFPPIRSLPYQQTNLPVQVNSFIGRDADLRELYRLERESKLLTLVGPGGCGKTRLAQELAGRIAPSEHPDGVWFSDLTPVADGGGVAQAIAADLELPEQVGRTAAETLVDYCRPRKVLVVLDNCEHLVDATARLVQELIGSCPDLHVIATSREPLNVPGETVWRVNPLSSSDATRLFLDRAHSIAPSLEWTAARLQAVTQIGDRLDGIPLAMELAAARVPMMPVEEILDRLESGLGFLGGGSRTASVRQQTLTATMDWSYGLLEPHEQALFQRLAVFPGSFSLVAAEQVCAEPDLEAGQVVDLLGQLVSKSLVLSLDVRYRMLGTIRQYAMTKLLAAGDLPQLRSSHADYYLRLAASRQPGEVAVWLDRLAENHDNFNAALSWALETDVALAARLVDELFAYWLLRGQISEARQWLADLLSRIGPDDIHRGPALLQAGAFAYVAGDFNQAEKELDEGLTRSRLAGDKSSVIRGLFFRGVLDTAREMLDAAELSLNEALAISLEISNQQYEGEVLHQLGMVASVRGASDEGGMFFQRSLDARRRAGRHDEAGMTLVFLALNSFVHGDPVSARGSIREALEIGLALHDRRSAWSLDVLACMTAADGRAERATRLAGAAAAMFDATGQKPAERWHQFTSAFLEGARSELGPLRAEEEWNVGRSLGFEEALDYALEGETVLAVQRRT